MAKEFTQHSKISEVTQKFKVLFGHKQDPQSDTSDYSDDCSTDSYDDSDPEFFSNVGTTIDIHKLLRKKKANNELPVEVVSSAVARRNASELIAEEEREKKKAEKRKAKKKRRKEKKKAEKEAKTNKKDTQNKKSTNKHNQSLRSTDGAATSEEEYLDPNSAFVAVAVSRKKKYSSVPLVLAEKDSKHKGKKNTSVETKAVDPVIDESEKLAVQGNKMASLEKFEEAVQYFSKAIRLVPNDYRFFGNRSFCYCQLEKYEQALKDADKAIVLAPQNPKGYYRRGEALGGLKQYKQAEQAFEKVLLFDDCDDARQELKNVQILQLFEMGFCEDKATAAIEEYNNVQAAVEALTAEDEPSSLGGEIYYSDEDIDEVVSPIPLSKVVMPALDMKMDPSNPEGHTSLWVGNVAQTVSEKQLTDMFSKFGGVHSVRVLPEKYCAFINFRDKASAGLAMKQLQHKELCGERLLIRYPDNPVGEMVVKKNRIVISGSQQSKQTGPVNGDECHFWRTTGCVFGPNCRNKHVKENKGIDKKPWQKVS